MNTTPLNTYIPIAEAIGALLHPYAEVVIHDLATQTITAIIHPFSKRKVGDPSLLEEESHGDTFPDLFPPYEKINWDGRRLKSVSATLRDSTGRAIGLFCINLDVSVFEQVQQVVTAFLTFRPLGAAPQELFRDDWKEQLHQFVHSYVRSRQTTVAGLTLPERHELIASLSAQGAFRQKHATDYIAQVLEISRATLYKHIKRLRGEA